MSHSSGADRAATSSTGPSTETVLSQHLKSFLHLTTQAPLEYVCTSALYLLNHVPSTRHAVLEYIGTFYKVATFLHLQFNRSQLKQKKNADVAEANNINHINQVIDLIETALIEILSNNKSNETWSVELTQWLVEILGEIVSNSGDAFANTPDMTIEEMNALRRPTVVDGLEIWSNQCKPTQSLLMLLQKCFTLVEQPSTHLNILEYILETTFKYELKLDWVPCYFSALNPQLIFENFFKFSLQDFFKGTKKVPKTNIMSFYALNFSNLVRNEVRKLLQTSYTKKEIVAFLLSASSQSSSLTTLLVDEVLNGSISEDAYSKSENELLSFFVTFFVIENNDSSITKNLFTLLKNIDNSVAVFDLITTLLEWFTSKEDCLDLHENPNFIKNVQNLMNSFLDDLITHMYLSKCETLEKSPESTFSEHFEFLKSLNTINGSSFNLLVEQIIRILKSESFKNLDRELIYKLLALLSINGNEHMANKIMSELTITPSKFLLNPNNSTDESFLVKMRQEITPFHSECMSKTINSIISSFDHQKNEENLTYFLENIMNLYEWDLQNKNFMSQNISSILIERECFIGLIKQLDVDGKFEFSIKIIQFYNKILHLNSESPEYLKLNISDLIICGNKLIDYFYSLITSISDEAAFEKSNEINGLIKLIENTIIHLSYNEEENNPYRNILLKTLIDKLFECSINVAHKRKFEEIKSFAELNEENFDENANLFTSNMNNVNNEVTLYKSKLKSIKNSLVDLPSYRSNSNKMFSQSKSIMNFAIMNLLEIICTKPIYDERQNESSTEFYGLKIRKEILTIQVCSLADLLVEHILLDQHFIDFQWASSGLNDFDDNFDGEVDALKLYIERDVAVQNKLENPNNNQILWEILEFITIDDEAFCKCSPIIRSILASIIIQWDSLQEQSTRNSPKTLDITIRLLNLINRLPEFMPKPLNLIVDIVPLLNSFETHIALLIIWRYLKIKMNIPLQTSKGLNIKVEIKHLRYIFQKNITKLGHLYSKFFSMVK